jgi:hypothetical protein
VTRYSFIILIAFRLVLFSTLSLLTGNAEPPPLIGAKPYPSLSIYIRNIYSNSLELQSPFYYSTSKYPLAILLRLVSSVSESMGAKPSIDMTI